MRRPAVLASATFVIVLTVLGAPAAIAQAPREAPRAGLLVVAHGADSGWNARVRAVVREVRWQGPVAVAFLMGPEAMDASWDVGVQSLVTRGASSIVAVPLMVSSHGSHFRQIQHYAGLDVPLPGTLAGHGHGAMTAPPVPVHVTPALDDADELGTVLAARWRELPAATRARPLVLVAHGPSDIADVGAWISGLQRATRELAAAVRPAPVHIGLLRDDAPVAVRAAAVEAIRDTIGALAASTGDSVTVMTVLVSMGSINRVTVPRDLDGLAIDYHGVALSPHPALARWIERVGSAAIAREPATLTPRLGAPSRPARR